MTTHWFESLTIYQQRVRVCLNFSWCTCVGILLSWLICVIVDFCSSSTKRILSQLSLVPRGLWVLRPLARPILTWYCHAVKPSNDITKFSSRKTLDVFILLRSSNENRIFLSSLHLFLSHTQSCTRMRAF